MRKAILLLWTFCFSTLIIRAQQSPPTDYQSILKQYETYMAAGNQQQAFELIASWYNKERSIVAAALLGDMYTNGIGTPADFTMACILYKSVADVDITPDENTNLFIAYCSRMYATAHFMIKESADDETLKYFRRAVSINNDASSLTMLGLIYIADEQKYDEGIRHLERAAERNSIIALGALGEEYKEAGEMDKAISYFERAATTPIYDLQNDLTHNATLSFMVSPNLNTNAAVKEYQRIACCELAEIYCDMEDTKTALVWLDRVNEDNDESLMLRSECYFHSNRENEALKILSDIYEQHHNTKALVYIGLFQHLMGNDEQARKSLEQAIQEGHEGAKLLYEEFFSTNQ